MKRIIGQFIILFLFSSTVIRAQSVSEVMRDSEEYIYEIGTGATVSEADQNALMQLTNRSVHIFSNASLLTEQVSIGESADFKSVFEEQTTTLGNIYLEDIGRHILPDEDGMKRVMRFVSRQNWERRYEVCRQVIEDYLYSAVDAKSDFHIDDALRYFTWAYVLLQTYPKDDISFPDVQCGMKQFCTSSIKEILADIDVRVIAIQKETGKNVLYPYQLFLDFMYKGEPIDYLTFNYFDGNGYVDGATVKDGRTSVGMSVLPKAFDLSVECLHKDLALTLAPNVYAVMRNPMCISSFEGSVIKVDTRADELKKKTKVNTADKRVKSSVQEKLAESLQKHAEMRSVLNPETQFSKMMEEVVEGISKEQTLLLKDYFTEDAWTDFTKIVSSGNPKIIRTPKLKYLQLDTLVICNSVPVKLKFPGNRSFVEDLSFRMSSASKKIIGVTYTLSSKTVENIMSMQWEDKARLTLLTFLENYRTAYCLKDISYIEKIFADDAYIIVGKELKKSDQPSAKGEEISLQLGSSAVQYQTKTKREYMTDLRKSFRSKQFVNIRFEECDPAKGYGSKEGIYAVQIRQRYFSDNYADDGFLTLAIDIRDEKDPLVKVRVWQKKKDRSYTAETMIEKTVSTEDGIY